MSMIKIYALIHPVTEKTFYVGATKYSLEQRLKGHLSNGWVGQTGFIKERVELFEELKKNNRVPKIILLKEVAFEDADYYEDFYYQYFISKGDNLIQDASKFKYTTTYSRKDLSDDGEFKTTFRVKDGLYNKLCEYGKENGMTLIGTIRYIISQFFLDKKQNG